MGLSWSIRHLWCPAPVKETKLQKHILKEASTFTHYRTRTLGKNGFPEDMNTDPAKTKYHEPRTEAKLIEKQSLLSVELVAFGLVWFGLVGFSFNANLEPQPRALYR